MKFDKILEAALPEAAKALPRGFANGSMADLRRAFVLWVTMAMVGLAAAG